MTLLFLVYFEDNNNNKILTVTFSTWTEGLADAYKRNKTFIPIPMTIPSSSLINKHDKNVALAGIKSVSRNIICIH